MEKAGDILNNLLYNLLEKKQNKKGTVYYHFFNKWELVVGKQLYGHTKVMDIKNGNLIIAVDHPGWLQMLRIKEKYVVRRIKKMFPQLNIKSMKITVNEHVFSIEKKEEKKKEEKKEIKTQNYDKEEKYSEYMRGIDTIKDKHLQNVLKRLYVSIAKKEEES